jgi:hypothetical protein
VYVYCLAGPLTPAQRAVRAVCATDCRGKNLYQRRVQYAKTCVWVEQPLRQAVWCTSYARAEGIFAGREYIQKYLRRVPDDFLECSKENCSLRHRAAVTSSRSPYRVSSFTTLPCVREQSGSRTLSEYVAAGRRRNTTGRSRPSLRCRTQFPGRR